MNLLNHFLFCIFLFTLFLPFTPQNLTFSLLFSILVNFCLDLDHLYYFLKKDKFWFKRRWWVQELGGFFLIGLPLALLLSFLNKSFFFFLSLSYLSHPILDYLCLGEAKPFSPFSKLKKKEKIGIFSPDSFVFAKDRSKYWEGKGISENFFTLVIGLLLFLIILLKS